MTDVFDPLSRRLRRFFQRNTPLYASTMSLFAVAILATGSVVLGMFHHSLIVQTNGLIAIIDIGNSLLFLAAVDRSTRSPDMAFNYGYGKYESLAILVSANLLMVLTVFTLIEAVSFFQRPYQDTGSLILVAWSAVALVIMMNTTRRLERYAKRFHLPMLHYDAELWRVDSWVEIGVIIGVVVHGLLQWGRLYEVAAIVDGIAAIGLVLLSLKAPIQHGRTAFRQLLDRTLPEDMQYRILGIIASHQHQMCEFRGVHTRQSVRDIFIEIDLVMPFDHTLEQLYTLESDILGELRKTFPTAIPRVYVTPCDKKCLVAPGSCPLRP
ncbi:MAG: cation diffusion facilitator family transporter [Ignavibacteriae bacterium]|nr:MAG: cation diffusion facilitator family transporter [Ignavibacteriota bacterium]